MIRVSRRDRPDLRLPACGEGEAGSGQGQANAPWQCLNFFPDPQGQVATLVESRVVPPEERDPANPASWGKVGRNEACPCGSGKKYKHCHGAFA